MDAKSMKELPAQTFVEGRHGDQNIPGHRSIEKIAL